MAFLRLRCGRWPVSLPTVVLALALLAFSPVAQIMDCNLLANNVFQTQVIKKASTRCCAISTMPRLQSDMKKFKVWHCWVVLKLDDDTTIVAEQEGATGTECVSPSDGAQHISAVYTCRTHEINSAMCKAAEVKRGPEFVSRQYENRELDAAPDWTLERLEQWVRTYSEQRPCYDRMSTNCQMFSSSLYNNITGAHTTVRQNFPAKMFDFGADPDLVDGGLIQVENAQAGSMEIDKIDPDPRAAAQEVVDIRADGRIEVVPTAERPHGWGRHHRLSHDWDLHATMDGTASP